MLYTFRTGVYSQGEYGSSILVTNCPSIKEGYEFLSDILSPEFKAASNINHVPHLNGKIIPMRTYQYKEKIPIFVSHRR